MRIENEVKLDFKDVLIRPKRSTLSSRSEVDISRTFTFRNSGKTWTGVPISASNMDTTGTIRLSKVLTKHKMFTCLHKFNKEEDYRKLTEDDLNHCALSTGINSEEMRIAVDNVKKFGFKFLCMDVANGYTETFVEAVKFMRSELPDVTIIAGNVVTGEMVEELILAGADIVKCGIGGGCFSGDTRILMANGTYKNISDIEIGDMVINKDGNPTKVLNKFNKGLRPLVEIRTNNWHDKTYVTPDHQFWVGDLSESSLSTIKNGAKYKLLDKNNKTLPKGSKYKWKELQNIDREKMTLLMPKNFNWNLDSEFTIDLGEFCERGDIQDDCIITKNQCVNKFNRYLKSNYNLGYIFGTFLGDGDARLVNSRKTVKSMSGACHWSFGLHETEIAKKLQKCIKDELDYECTIAKKDKNILSVNCYNKCFSKMLMEFSKKTNKHLPSKYFCSDKKYIEGIYDGLVDSDGSMEKCKSEKIIYTLTNTSKPLLEVFYWCCMNLGKSFSSRMKKKSIGNLKGASIENLSDSFRIKTHTFNRFTKNYVYSEIFDYGDTKSQVTWDIEVECPTHSFIANNSIVHNSACTTRKQTGVGYPQLSAVIECADAAHGLGGLIMADGGCTVPGDIAKAFGAGADFVMLGGMFAGHNESGGKNVLAEDGVTITHKEFYGMSSDTAMKKYCGGVAKYRSSEGKTVRVKYRGPVEDTVLDMLGGLRSACTYIGALKLKEVSKRTTFIRVTQQLNNVFGSA